MLVFTSLAAIALALGAFPVGCLNVAADLQQREKLPFGFGYNVHDDSSGNDYSHTADSDGYVVTGEYRVLMPDGRTQVVTYKADRDNGYIATVSYEGQSRIAYPDRPVGTRPPQTLHQQHDGGQAAPEETGDQGGFARPYSQIPSRTPAAALTRPRRKFVSSPKIKPYGHDVASPSPALTPRQDIAPHVEEEILRDATEPEETYEDAFAETTVEEQNISEAEQYVVPL